MLKVWVCRERYFFMLYYSIHVPSFMGNICNAWPLFCESVEKCFHICFYSWWSLMQEHRVLWTNRFWYHVNIHSVKELKLIDRYIVILIFYYILKTMNYLLKYHRDGWLCSTKLWKSFADTDFQDLSFYILLIIIQPLRNSLLLTWFYLNRK